jgi:hypothetical protein
MESTTDLPSTINLPETNNIQTIESTSSTPAAPAHFTLLRVKRKRQDEALDELCKQIYTKN